MVNHKAKIARVIVEHNSSVALQPLPEVKPSLTPGYRYILIGERFRPGDCWAIQDKANLLNPLVPIVLAQGDKCNIPESAIRRVTNV